MKQLCAAAVAAVGLCLATVVPAAAASSAVVTVTINERAGPDPAYPPVAVIPAGAGVTIFGCLDDASWCDVAYGQSRGWVPGGDLQAYYQSRPVIITPAYCGLIGVPFIGFDIGVYWNSYYRGRPFYGQRDRFVRFEQRHPHHHGANVAVVGPNRRGGQAYTAHPPRGGQQLYSAHPHHGPGPANVPHRRVVVHHGPHPAFHPAHGPAPHFAAMHHAPAPHFAAMHHGPGKRCPKGRAC
jgi:uncharacterized protein YraI